MTELMHTPLFGLTLTLLAYQCAMWAYTRSGKMAMLHPTISGAVLIAVALKALQLDYFAYYQDINWLNFLLGPATVALAVPLYRQLPCSASLLAPYWSRCFLGRRSRAPRRCC